MQLIKLLTTATLALGAAAAPSAAPVDKTSDTNVARGNYYNGYGGCGSGGYYYNDRCYCHQRNYWYNDNSCEYYCHEDAYYDYGDECCYCYNSYDYSDDYGCRGY